MKDCRDCEYFNGYIYEDGTPRCDYNGDYENCPYNDDGYVKKDECKITLEIPNIMEYIKHTVSNTVNNAVYEMIDNCVTTIVKEEIKETAESYVEESLRKVIDDEIKAYMEKDITVGGGWREPQRTLSRNEYLAECTSKAVEEKLNPSNIVELVRDYCRNTIEKEVDKIKNAVNTGIKTQFDETTRKALSDNVVSMLMAGDTYKRLSDSMERLLK